jgi:hypothetical protein
MNQTTEAEPHEWDELIIHRSPARTGIKIDGDDVEPPPSTADLVQ